MQAWQTRCKRSAALCCVLVALLALASPLPASVIEEWATVHAPAAPEVKPVTVSAKETALLVLDIQKQTCNAEQRPRCLATLPAIREFLGKARAGKLVVAHSLTSKGMPEDVLPEAAQLPGEPVVRSSVDKFLNTDLESILKGKGITTVIVTGTAANGAVLHTATGAATRGFKVIVPVDGLSADLYAEQYTAWHMLNAPGTRNQTQLTRFDSIELQE